MKAQEIYDKIMERWAHIHNENHKRRLRFIQPIEEQSLPDEIWWWAKPDKKLANEVSDLFATHSEKGGGEDE